MKMYKDIYVSTDGYLPIVILEKNNQGISYVRNACKKHSMSIGADYHWQIDDNIKDFPNPKMYPKSFEYYYKVYRLFKYDRTFGGWKENIHYNE